MADRRSEGDSFPLVDKLYNESSWVTNSSPFLPINPHGSPLIAATNDSDDGGGGGGAGMDLFTGRPEGYAVPVVFACIFIIGIIGNGTLIYTVARNKNMRNTPNIFIVSLALGDFLLILVSVPFTATIYTFTQWPYGPAICKLNEFLQSMSLGVSVFTLTALSGDRYTAIVDPMRKHTGNPLARTLIIAACIWVLSIALAVPELIAADTVRRNYSGTVFELCESHPEAWGEWYPRVHVTWRFIVYFALPMLVIGVFYVLMARILMLTAAHMPGERNSTQGNKQMEARKKVAKVVLSFVLVFIVCWLPRHVYTLWFYYDPGLYNMFWHVFKILGFCLSFINSCVNPLALYFLSKQFRRYYNNYLFCCCRRRTGRRAKRAAIDMDTTRTRGYSTGRNNSRLSATLLSTHCDSKI